MAAMQGKRLLQSLLLDKKGTEKYVSFGLRAELFQGLEVELFESISSHVEEYGRLPKPATIEIDCPDDLEPPEFYMDHVLNRFAHREIVAAMKEAQVDLHEKNPGIALDRFRELVVDLSTKAAATQIVDFSTQGAQVIDDEYNLLTKGNVQPGIMTGYPTLDSMLNGLRGGDVMSIVGRPGQGKTYMLLKMAHHAWHIQKKRPLFVSMEMKPLPLIQRITAMHQKMSITHLRKAEYPKSKHKKLIDSLSKLGNDHEQLWIVDGNLTAQVQDMLMLCHQLQPDVAYIDGGYLLQTSDKRVPRWERIAQTLEFVKQNIASALGIPAVITYQFNKAGVKEKELENIGGSDAIGQLSSCVLALWEKEESEAEFLVKKKVDIIKGRSGEEGEFYINWRFDVPPFMDFSEIIDDTAFTEELEYL